MTCTFEGCTNNKFVPHEECALHCVKSKYQDDKLKGILSEFYDLLKVYIADLIDSKPLTSSPNLQSVLNSSPKSFILGSNINIGEKIREGDLNDEVLRDLIRKYNKSNEITISDIYFPYRDNRDNFDYFKLLNLFSGAHLIYCHLYIDNWQLEDVAIFFDDCVFYNSFDVTPIRMLSNDTNCLFSECNFKDKVRVSPTEMNSVFEDSLFSGCSFVNYLVIERLIFRKEVISYTDNTQSKLFAIEISKCIFEDKIKINNMNLACLSIEDTEFQSKLEVKETTAQVFIFKNSNVSKVFDLFGSSFIKAEFSKSIFNDFAGFEDVQFGSEQEKGNKEFLTIFKYVTFMDFSSFRGSKFNSGLDFSKTNLKDKPNFLGVYVDSKNTKRETFRIIKNSFDDAGNNIEENKFFVEEMKAYRKELKVNGGSWFERFILFCNRWISNFGSSYIMPIGWLIVSILIFSEIIEWHSSFFNETENTYFWHSNFDYISIKANNFAKNFLPFSRFLTGKSGIEFVSLLFYIWFAVLIWQTIVAVKRHTQR